MPRRPARSRRPSGLHPQQERARTPSRRRLSSRAWRTSSRLWEPEAQALAERFRTIRYDLRLWGRSESPGWRSRRSRISSACSTRSASKRAALVGLPLGGGLALDAALAHPDRVWAVAYVAGGVTGMPVDPYTEEQRRSSTPRSRAETSRTAAEIDLAVWGLLGGGDELRDLWLSTPDALGVPDGTEWQKVGPAHERLHQFSVPTLVLLASHDPPELREAGMHVDSDHYLTLREPELVTRLLQDFHFLAEAARD